MRNFYLQSSLRDSVLIYDFIPSNKLPGYFHSPLTGLKTGIQRWLKYHQVEIKKGLSLKIFNERPRAKEGQCYWIILEVTVLVSGLTVNRKTILMTLVGKLVPPPLPSPVSVPGVTVILPADLVPAPAQATPDKRLEPERALQSRSSHSHTELHD